SILDHEDIPAISFVGSQPVAEYVYKRGAENLKRVQALAGAKNHTIVLKDADLNNATTQIMNAAFGSAGECCMAASVIAIENDIADEFIEKLSKKVDEQKMGDGLDPDTFLGPVIRKEHKERTLNYIKTGEKEGAKLVRDGRKDEARSEERRVGKESR